MKEDQKCDGDGSSPLRRISARDSMMRSLRDLIAADDRNRGGGNENDDVEDDDDSFIFSDHVHKDQEFEMISNSLVGFGVMTDDEAGGESSEKATLLAQQKKNKVERNETSARDLRGSKLVAYDKGQRELFLEVLDQIDDIQSTTRKKKGFNEWKFAFGLINCLLIAYMFGAYPAHFWILYAVETIFWMSYKFRGMCRAKPLCEALYYLDFCWVMNFSGVLIIALMSVLDNRYDFLSVEVREKLFLACFGVFCGPVFLAAMVLPFVAFLFHDINTMANLIIHLMPSMVMYNFRWHAIEINEAYPLVFRHVVSITEEMNNGENKFSPTRIALAVYFTWFILYTSWMLLVGLKLPVISKQGGKPLPKYDTVFHSTWQGGPCELVGTKVWKRPKETSRDCSERNDYELRDFLLYMVGHAFGSCGVGIILVGNLLCFRGGKIVHGTLLWFTTILCAKRGADRYTYYVTTMYGQKVRKAFQKLEVQHLHC